MIERVDGEPQRAVSSGQEAPQEPSGEPFMIRCNIPGGRLTAEQYLLLDDIATRHMHGSLRITARYNLQLHGTLRAGRQATIERLAGELAPLLNASGAVGRPIMYCPAPVTGPAHAAVDAVAQQLSAHLLGRATAAYEIWCGGEKIAESSGAVGWEASPSPKARPSIHFKVGIAAPGDNCIDVYTHDLGLVPVVRDDALAGFNVLVGGSMGMARRAPGVFPRLAEPLAFVEPPHTLPLLDQILHVEGEAAARAGRQRGRFKYLLASLGLEGLHHELAERLGGRLHDPVPMPSLELHLHLGWHPQGGDCWCLGLSIENGRIADQGTMRLRTGLREVINRYRPKVCLTPNQDLLLTGVSAAHRSEVEARLRAHGIPWPDNLSALRRYAMACPARPSCGHALAEAERALPGLIAELEAVLAQLGLQDEGLTVRMNGCSFGCTRPYVADLAFIGDAPECYSVYVGGRTDGSQINWLFKEQVPGEFLVQTVRPLLTFFGRARLPGEAFGDFCRRLGREALQRCGSPDGAEDRRR
jgi:sulfite reductase (ferredoxin)